MTQQQPAIHFTFYPQSQEQESRKLLMEANKYLYGEDIPLFKREECDGYGDNPDDLVCALEQGVNTIVEEAFENNVSSNIIIILKEKNQTTLTRWCRMFENASPKKANLLLIHENGELLTQAAKKLPENPARIVKPLGQAMALTYIK